MGDRSGDADFGLNFERDNDCKILGKIQIETFILFETTSLPGNTIDL